jgi:hypothetical protein
MSFCSWGVADIILPSSVDMMAYRAKEHKNSGERKERAARRRRAANKGEAERLFLGDNLTGKSIGR